MANLSYKPYIYTGILESSYIPLASDILDFYPEYSFKMGRKVYSLDLPCWPVV